MKATDSIVKKFVQANGYTIATLVWVVDGETFVPISDDEAEMLPTLDRYYEVTDDAQ